MKARTVCDSEYREAVQEAVSVGLMRGIALAFFVVPPVAMLLGLVRP